MMKKFKSEIASLNEAIEKNNSFLIVTHETPDGDALGSSFAVRKILINKGKKADIYAQKNINIPLNYFFSGENICLYEDLKEEYDCAVCLDCSTLSYLFGSEVLKRCKNIICIDHHVSNEGFADINIVDPSSAACCEIIFSLLKALDLEINKEIALYLYVGIVSDTGNFRYSNTSAETHMIASELLNYDINPGEIDEYLSLRSKRQLELYKEAVANIYGFNDDKILLSIIEDVRNGDNTDGIIDVIRYIEGVKIAALAKKVNENCYKISLRTPSDNIDLSKIAVKYSGGGHKKAAGFTFNGSRNELIKEIENLEV